MLLLLSIFLSSKPSDTCIKIVYQYHTVWYCTGTGNTVLNYFVHFFWKKYLKNSRVTSFFDTNHKVRAVEIHYSPYQVALVTYLHLKRTNKKKYSQSINICIANKNKIISLIKPKQAFSLAIFCTALPLIMLNPHFF